MGILASGIGRIREFNARRRERAVTRLLKEASEIEQRLTTEAKRLGINLGDSFSRSYYDALGLKYTTDQKAIKEAYLTLVKRYHPDINKSAEATKRTAEINTAYAVLKDRRKKEEYDAKSQRGSSSLGDAEEKSVSNALLRRYSELRAHDFEEFNKRVAVPQYRDSIKAAIEETANWRDRFGRAAALAFGRFRDHGKGIRRAEALAKGFMKSNISESDKERLRDALVRMEGLSRAYIDAERAISSITKRIEDEISSEEDAVSERLRRSIG